MFLIHRFNSSLGAFFYFNNIMIKKTRLGYNTNNNLNRSNHHFGIKKYVVFIFGILELIINTTLEYTLERIYIR